MAGLTPTEANEFLKDIEKTRADTEKLKPLIDQASDPVKMNEAEKALNEKKQLNERTKTLLKEKVGQVALSQDVEKKKAEIDTKLAGLDERLNELTKLLEAKKAPNTPAAPAKPPSAPKGFLGRTADTIGGYFDIAKEYAASTFESMSPGMKRGFYGVMASPAMLGMGIENWFGIGGMIDYAKKNLAILDIQDALGDLPEEERKNFAFNGTFADTEWKLYKKNLIAKPENDTLTLASEFIEKIQKARKEAGIPSGFNPEVITLTKLMKPEAALNSIAAVQNDKKKEGAKKNFAATTVDFASETSFEKGALKVSEKDITPEGEIVKGSDAEVLLKAKGELGNSEKIIIAGSKVVLDWIDKKTVTIPSKTDVPLSAINKLIGMNPKPDTYPQMEIEKSFATKDTTVLLKKNGSQPVLMAQNNPNVFDAILRGRLMGKKLGNNTELVFDLDADDFEKGVPTFPSKQI